VNQLEQLLIVQTHDTHLDQLRHRRDSLPERAELEAQTTDLARVDAAVADAEARKAVLVSQQRKIEDEVALIEDKAAEVDNTLYRSGTITSPREAQAYADELESLGKRQRRLEDDVIELMEQIEPIDGELTSLGDERTQLGNRLDETERALASVEGEVDREITDVDRERTSAAIGIDATRLAEYEQLRKQLGGIAVARLTGGTCGGCNLTLSAMERDRFKGLGPDDAAYCEECGRLLVH
jgi:predicted  nucleic acid-binding Zn-ribbon protein